MLEGLRRLFLRGGEPPEVGDGPVGLADILDRGWLELFYQPKIELKTKRLVGAEGLVRARHPTQGLLSPGVFLPGASESDMLRLTERVIITALQDWQACAAAGIPLKLSVNAHCRDLAPMAPANIDVAGAHHGGHGRRDHPRSQDCQ